MQQDHKNKTDWSEQPPNTQGSESDPKILYSLEAENTLLQQLLQDRGTDSLCQETRKSDNDLIQWHTLPKYFNYPPATQLMSQECMQTNAIDALRYCLSHPDLQHADKDTIIDILRVMIRVKPILRDPAHQQTRLILMYMLKHRNAFSNGQFPKIEKIKCIFQLQRPELIKTLCQPLQGLGRDLDDLTRLSPQLRKQISHIAYIHSPADDIHNQLIKLQKELLAMDEKSNDLFHIAAHAYRRILEIKPFKSNNKTSASALVNRIFLRKGIKAIDLAISPEHMDLGAYCHSMQGKSILNLAQHIKKQYILQHLDCPYTQSMIEKQPELVRHLLCQLIIKQADHLFIQLLEKYASPGTACHILNSPLSKGWTILHFACKHNKLNLITRLIELGADPNIRNHSQKTPFDLINKALRDSQDLTQFPLPRTPDRFVSKVSQ